MTEASADARIQKADDITYIYNKLDTNLFNIFGLFSVVITKVTRVAEKWTKTRN